ncbi:MAG: hypothetical protein AUG89_08985 [Acidobacteria bacterium 13_1_20CM_4_56_7]|nr:MAG: hypothetical protein AUG89_08985 [Acidobacteria bacterium 13_1_20CM_4_56_7]
MRVGASFDLTGNAVLERSTAFALSIVLADRSELRFADTCTVCSLPSLSRPNLITTSFPCTVSMLPAVPGKIRVVRQVHHHLRPV